ncbi:hypothetical protein KSF73_01350 [Burkholderiaceae bacterium DAT-1]|nr:hypothetical protein [Burkholderiaceae bacterium DAT-1]
MHLRALFLPGNIVATPTAMKIVKSHRITIASLLARHLSGDWGNVDPDDQTANDLAIYSNQRILSSFILGKSDTVWVITEADRHQTTILLPGEY